MLLHLRAVGVVGDETAVKLLDARRAEAPAGVHVDDPVSERRGGGGGRETQLSLTRARLTGEFGDLALAKTAAQEVVDAVAA